MLNKLAIETRNHEAQFAIKYCIHDKFRDFFNRTAYGICLSLVSFRPLSRRIRILCVPSEKVDLHKTRSRIVTRVLRGLDLSFHKNTKSNSNRNRSEALITSVTNETSFFLGNEKDRSFDRSFIRPSVRSALSTEDRFSSAVPHRFPDNVRSISHL